jgi:hypothetical protein
MIRNDSKSLKLAYHTFNPVKAKVQVKNNTDILFKNNMLGGYISYPCVKPYLSKQVKLEPPALCNMSTVNFCTKEEGIPYSLIGTNDLLSIRQDNYHKWTERNKLEYRNTCEFNKLKDPRNSTSYSKFKSERLSIGKMATNIRIKTPIKGKSDKLVDVGLHLLYNFK